jgi:CRISPR/Cas system-associated protein Csm6
MVKVRPNPKLVKRLEEEDSDIEDLSKERMKKKESYFSDREKKLKHLIEHKPISAQIKKILAKRKARRMKSHLSRFRSSR